MQGVKAIGTHYVIIFVKWSGFKIVRNTFITICTYKRPESCVVLNQMFEKMTQEKLFFSLGKTFLHFYLSLV